MKHLKVFLQNIKKVNLKKLVTTNNRSRSGLNWQFNSVRDVVSLYRAPTLGTAAILKLLKVSGMTKNNRKVKIMP